MLEIMGINPQKQKENQLKECAYCNIHYPIEIRFCNFYSRSLDVEDAIQMEKETDDKTRDLITELMRKEHQKTRQH